MPQSGAVVKESQNWSNMLDVGKEHCFKYGTLDVVTLCEHGSYEGIEESEVMLVVLRNVDAESKLALHCMSAIAVADVFIMSSYHRKQTHDKDTYTYYT